MILDDLVLSTEKRILKEQQNQSLTILKKIVNDMPIGSAQDIYDLFKTPKMSLIAEIKKASPSKGIITQDFPYLSIAKTYNQSGVTAISVLTEPNYFKGNIKFLEEISASVSVPVLRKDFIINSYMIYQAKAAGASMILLIVAILSPQILANYIQLAHSLGLAVIVEVHDSNEIETALKAGAKMIGVNNRDLKTYTINLNNSIKLRNLVPENIIFIAESGISSNIDVTKLAHANVNGILIGETLMRATNKKDKITELLNLKE